MEAGAKASETNEDEETAVHVAAREGNTLFIDLFLQTDHSALKAVNSLNKSKKSALLLASAHGHAETVSHLLRHGAQPNITLAHVEEWAKRASKWMSTYSFRKLDTSAELNNLKQPIEEAVAANHPEIVRILLQGF